MTSLLLRKWFLKAFLDSKQSIPQSIILLEQIYKIIQLILHAFAKRYSSLLSFQTKISTRTAFMNPSICLAKTSHKQIIRIIRAVIVNWLRQLTLTIKIILIQLNPINKNQLFSKRAQIKYLMIRPHSKNYRSKD